MNHAYKLEQLLKYFNKDKSQFQCYITRLADYYSYEFVIYDGKNIVSRTVIDEKEVMMDNYEKLITEYEKQSKLYNSKLFKVLR